MEKREQLANAIGKIAYGYIFLYIDINIGTVDILMGWMGMMFIINALRNTILEEEPSIKLILPLGILLWLDEFIGWIGKVFSITLPFDIELYTIFIIIVSLYFHFQLLTNLANIANRYQCKEETKLLTLRTIRTLLATIFVFVLKFEKEWMIFIIAIVQIFVCIWICKVLFGFRKSLRCME